MKKHFYMIFPVFFIMLVLGLSFMNSCAVVKAPSGGPKDTIAPVIEGIYPSQSEINFSDDYVDLLFSKYMNKGKVAGNIFIQPELKFEPSWWGRRLRINFLEERDSNTTYAISLGTDYVDYHGNKPASAFSLIFSTGMKIDSGRIVGKLFGEKPDGYFIYAYNLDKISEDTLNFSNQKPDYREPDYREPDYKIQCGTSGEFLLNALKPAKYRLIAINDKFSDGLYSQGIDEFSSTTQDFVVDSQNEDVPFASFLKGEIIDRIPPELQSVYAKNARSIIATFSESLDSASIIPSNFTIKDSLAQDNVGVEFVHFESEEKRNKIELILSEKINNIDTSLVWILETSLDLRDSSQNKILDSASFAYFLPSSVENKSLAGLKNIPFKDSTKNIDPLVPIELEFNLPVKNSPTFSLFTLDSIPQEIPVNINNNSNKNYSITSDLEYEKGYRLLIDLTNIESFFGENKQLLKSSSRDTTLLRDTIIKLDFFTKKPVIFSKISGMLADSTNLNSGFILQFIDKKNAIKHSQYLKEEGGWSIDSVEAGTYKIRVFCDENKNGKYDKGNDSPFEFSERFFFIEKEIDVKERWDQEDIIIILRDEKIR